MIIDKLVKLKIGGRNIKHFRSINSEYNLYDEIEVPVEYLSDSSNVKINCICDNCYKPRYISYQKYRDSESLYSGYFCQSCSHIKKRITNLYKYGYENYTSTNEFKIKSKKSINIKYRCDNVFQSEVIKNKIKISNLSKYGVEYISQNADFRRRILISSYSKFSYNGLIYQGSYEKDFLYKYFDKVDISEATHIDYFLEKNRVYFPDFFIKSLNLIVEIKSSYTYKLHEEKNLEKMNKCKSLGYNFIFIIDKDYSEFEKMILL